MGRIVRELTVHIATNLTKYLHIKNIDAINETSQVTRFYFCTRSSLKIKSRLSKH